MEDAAFDTKLIGMAMTQAEALGWSRVGVVDAAREAGLALDRARARFPTRGWILLRLGVRIDQSALAEGEQSGTTREKLFDALMRRFDAMQPYRGGLRAVLHAVSLDPLLALMLAAETRNSLRWLAQAAGLDVSGLSGGVRLAGVFAVWVQALRAWAADDSVDLSGTMVALDRALDRAESIGRFLGAGAPAAGVAETSAEPLSRAPDNGA